MRTPIATAALTLLLLAGCSAADEPATEPDATTETAAASDSAPAVDPDLSAGRAEALLAEYDLAGLAGSELVDTLDATELSERPEGLMASVRYDEVLISAPEWEEPEPVAIDNGEFYLSFAPYVDTTHECYFHSLTTCVGELGGEDFDVTITDATTGEVLVDETITTFDNGFAGVWLPRDVEAMLRIEGEAGVAETLIATGPEDPTCLTTVQLA